MIGATVNTRPRFCVRNTEASLQVFVEATEIYSRYLARLIQHCGNTSTCGRRPVAPRRVTKGLTRAGQRREPVLRRPERARQVFARQGQNSQDAIHLRVSRRGLRLRQLGLDITEEDMVRRALETGTATTILAIRR